MERVIAGSALVAAAFAFAVYTNRQDNKLDRAVMEQTSALVFICSTTEVLDELVIQARDQIDSSLKNGIYARLLKQGVITEANIQEAKRLKVKYDETHQRLRLPNACQKVEK